MLVWHSGRFKEEAVIDSLEMVYWLLFGKRKKKIDIKNGVYGLVTFI